MHLRYFVELAHTHHYTKAAERLCITQPSLSHAIAQLEAEVGVPLFEKTGRNTVLTRFGEQFLSYAESSLKTLDDGVTALQKGAKGEGTIRLGLVRPAGVSFVPGLAEKFLKENPDKDIHFTFGNGITHELIKELHEQHYDLIFSSNPKTEVGLTSKVVFQQDMVVIVPYPYVYFSEDSGLRYEVDCLFDAIGKRPKIAYEILEDEVVAGLVARNFGIAIIPEIDILSSLDVKIIRIEKPVRYRNIYMVHNNRAYMPPVVKAFRDFVLRECGGVKK